MSVIDAALPLATLTKQVVIGPDALTHLAEVVTTHFGDAAVVVVADDITWGVAGERVDAALRATGRPVLDALRVPGNPTRVQATAENVELVKAFLEPLDVAAIAVGSGTINDLVKRASSLLGRRYMVVATASSMDGYVASGAPITVNGYKKNLPCDAPIALVADSEVLGSAPAIMRASGYGDLLGKIPSGACWLIADRLGIEAIDWTLWPFLQEPFRHALARAGEVAAGDPDATAELGQALILSGLTIQAYNSSRVGSGAEHIMSHYWEMLHLGGDWDPPLSHGLKVGLGTVAIAALYERILARDLSTLDVEARLASWPTEQEREAYVRSVFPHPDLVDEAVAQSLAKHVDAEAMRARLNLAKEVWPTLSQELREQLQPASEFADQLRVLAAPTHPRDVGLTLADMRAAYLAAQTIRNRYTVLDFAYETGIFDECLDELFAADGYWGSQGD
ncbi:sn-glycerol-1-phosphate dehydrogenase [Propionicicella superfundia]|uniref:sn-glycerol-1-phosphate dehydrogenase n=1 Tax=Propionicicella superfundia TaxID=348582 RepID=UPI00041B215F|nr:sn-glycerol-1-phosphate dehydrogenase [Propionicicella superfundia]